jgi:putative ubiquitin-RnfH superfamily antitoxin RatB of RatAB toxin-antitoxin module
MTQSITEPTNSQEDEILIEVAYARPDVQVIIPLYVKNGTTLEQAIKQSGVLEDFPEIDLEKNKLGIFSKISAKDTVLREKDRVEIYRPLIADPKQVRKQRAKEGKAMKKGGGKLNEADNKTTDVKT